VTPILLTLLVAVSTFGGALLGMWLRPKLPEQHVDDTSRDVVRVAIGLVVTMTALILGLVVSSAKTEFDAEDSAVKQSAADVLALDQALELYGSETVDLRRSVRDALAARITQAWPESGTATPFADNQGTNPMTHGLMARILALTPTTDAQRWLQSRALQLSSDLEQSRWLVIERQGSAAGQPFVIVLTCWLALIFISFGLFAPRHATGIGTLIACSLSVAAAIFLILEMEQPYQGFIKVSPGPLQFALAQLNKPPG
jgi:hypothetical protein